jgi:hypothetical protein
MCCTSQIVVGAFLTSAEARSCKILGSNESYIPNPLTEYVYRFRGAEKPIFCFLSFDWPWRKVGLAFVSYPIFHTLQMAFSPATICTNRRLLARLLVEEIEIVDSALSRQAWYSIPCRYPTAGSGQILGSRQPG